MPAAYKATCLVRPHNTFLFLPIPQMPRFTWTEYRRFYPAFHPYEHATESLPRPKVFICNPAETLREWKELYVTLFVAARVALYNFYSDEYEIHGWIELGCGTVPGYALLNYENQPVQYTFESFELEWRLLQESEGEDRVLSAGPPHPESNYTTYGQFVCNSSRHMDGRRGILNPTIEFEDATRLSAEIRDGKWRRAFTVRIPSDSYGVSWDVDRFFDVTARAWFKSDLIISAPGEYTPLVASLPSDHVQLRRPAHHRVFCHDPYLRTTRPSRRDGFQGVYHL
jgi:hypothetical protein